MSSTTCFGHSSVSDVSFCSVLSQCLQSLHGLESVSPAQMLPAWPVLYHKIVWSKHLQPSCQLAFWVLEVELPLQGSVVRPYYKLPATGSDGNYALLLFSCGAVISLVYAQTLAVVGYHLLFSALGKGLRRYRCCVNWYRYR